MSDREKERDLFGRIIDIHQEVREHVEREFPGYRVDSVRDEGRTRYSPPLCSLADDPEQLVWVLVRDELYFKVEARTSSGLNGLTCEVHVLPDGTLRIGGETFSIAGGYFLERRRERR